MRTYWQTVVALALAAGCSGPPGALHPPRVNPASAASAAIAQYDRDGDGKLSKDEWSASPGLTAIAERCDANGDGVLDADEIRRGIEQWQEHAVGPRAVPFTVRLDGRPLAGAVVRLVPEEFMGPEIKPAFAETGSTGAGQLTMAAEHMPRNAPKLPLVQPGLYRVEITHPSRHLPARYNTQTTLGMEITSSNPGTEGMHWSLKSK